MTKAGKGNMSIDVKICGITDSATARAAADAGARWLGFVFYPPSPRHISDTQARALVTSLPKGPERVGVFVDADMNEIKILCHLMQLDWVQLHGSESPATVKKIKQETKCKIIKAIPVRQSSDLKQVELYENIVDMLLFDAKPDAGELPGGNAKSFSWDILNGFSTHKPWMLAGGITTATIENAVRTTGAKAVDVSSGVETLPGKKSQSEILAFFDVCNRVKNAPEK